MSAKREDSCPSFTSKTDFVYKMKSIVNMLFGKKKNINTKKQKHFDTAQRVSLQYVAGSD